MMYGFPYQMQQPRTDIGQVGSEQEAVNAYVAAGCSKIFFTPDDSMVFVKSVGMNGQTAMDVFVRRTVRPVEPVSDYVTREELAEMLKALKSPVKGKSGGADE